MISIDDVTVAYGGFVLLDRINFHISETDKIGLVGKNGAGKSTIMKLIMGLQNPTSGQIDKPNHITIGYLPQIMEHHRGRSVIDEAMTAFDETGPVGFFTIRKPGEDDKKVSLGYVIVDPGKRGKGYGKQMLRLGLKFIFEVYGADEAGLDVFDSNPRAYNCYKAIGFRETGNRELWTAGGYTWNYIEMAISKSEYEKQTQ